MPRKTREQKIRAQERRLYNLDDIRPQLVKSQSQAEESIQPASAASTVTYEKNTGLKPKIHINEADYSYVKHDLIKITIFLFLTVILIVVLYFLLRG